MKPFTIYHTMSESLAGQQEQLVPLIREVATPDMIYLLGASLYRRRSESIFCTTLPTAQHTADYSFLVLMGDTQKKPLSQWQDQIEQHCSLVMAVTVLVLETNTFKDWLTQGHLFARQVNDASCCLYNADHVSFPASGVCDPVTEQQALAKQYQEGLCKAKEFLAGVELFRIRKQHKMSAFMLHQSTEQALSTLLKTKTGFYSCTHNIDRLLRYASLVCYQLPDVFPRNTENEKRLFGLLQKAYIDSRYREDYTICLHDLLLLTTRVVRIMELLEESGKVFI
ncbi:MAG: HEPN domain-containing protein [Chitinophagaceae bacterium]|nr:HEPN domain-containing protein [Chitinophagaceae bacterium]MCA6459762.1 HEPN domain-containing protein [Chitinophagaceae bacterium]MCA6466295.1 HEPN domain-containing protein [Chitinophagaceae bacterium]